MTTPPPTQKPKHKTLHFWAFQTHLWLGLVLGVYFSVIAFSGSMIILSDWLDALRAPSLVYVTPLPDQQKPFSQILATFKSANPDTRLLSVTPPPSLNRSWRFISEPTPPQSQPTTTPSTGPASSTAAQTESFIDPYTLKILGSRNLQQSQAFLHFFENLHKDLLLKRDPGRKINSILAIPLLLLLLSGLILWWPKTLRALTSQLKIAFTKGLARLTWDTHHAVAIWALPLLFVTVLIATYFGWERDLKDTLKNQFGPRSQPLQIRPVWSSGATPSQPATLERTIENLIWLVPTAQITSISGIGSKTLEFKLLFTVNTITYSASAKADAQSGQITSITKPSNTADFIAKTPLAIHAGQYLHPSLRFLYFLLGLTPAILFITGAAIFIRRQKNKPKLP